MRIKCLAVVPPAVACGVLVLCMAVASRLSADKPAEKARAAALAMSGPSNVTPAGQQTTNGPTTLFHGAGKEADRARKARMNHQRKQDSEFDATWAYPAPEGSCILETYNDEGPVFVACSKQGLPKSEYFTIPNYASGYVWVMQYNGKYILVDDYSSGSPEKVILYKVGKNGVEVAAEQSVYYVIDGYLSRKSATITYYSDDSGEKWGLVVYDMKLDKLIDEGPYEEASSDFLWFAGYPDVYQVWGYSEEGWSLKVLTPRKVLFTMTGMW